MTQSYLPGTGRGAAEWLARDEAVVPDEPVISYEMQVFVFVIGRLV